MASYSSTGDQIMWPLRPLPSLYSCSSIQIYIIYCVTPYLCEKLFIMGKLIKENFWWMVWFLTILYNRARISHSVLSFHILPPDKVLTLWYHPAWHSQVGISCPSREKSLLKCQDITMIGQEYLFALNTSLNRTAIF